MLVWSSDAMSLPFRYFCCSLDYCNPAVCAPEPSSTTSTVSSLTLLRASRCIILRYFRWWHAVFMKWKQWRIWTYFRAQPFARSATFWLINARMRVIGDRITGRSTTHYYTVAHLEFFRRRCELWMSHYRASFTARCNTNVLPCLGDSRSMRSKFAQPERKWIATKVIRGLWVFPIIHRCLIRF